MVMGKEAGTKCSHCGKNGHNSRTCTEKTVKLFGVKICLNKKEDPVKKTLSMGKKSFSMGNLQHAMRSEHCDDEDDVDRGYLSDGEPVRSKKDGHERKKGVPWTAEEHRIFLEGLTKLGKGDWRGISRSFVTTRTPTQVASHAQKYFLRKAAASKKKRRSSLFDMAIMDSGEALDSAPLPLKETDNVPKQNAPPVQFANQVASNGMETPPTTPVARTPCIPSFNGFPYMTGTTNGNISYFSHGVFPAVSVVPVFNIGNVCYSYQPKPQSTFTASTPIVSQSLINPLPPSASHCVAKVETHSSSRVNTDLELGIAPPDLGTRTKQPTHMLNMGGAIGVI
ncbi:hypothetical protein IFM89_002874 [Coptis chinensis]|uniref:Uncharacterized protein n=1 Tax=Coptis chinensis TaxID=261450 RepID=A0A835LGS4_9MAGN|nr:hypothetical protein IFM89_002874 [Coptis chinensis]